VGSWLRDKWRLDRLLGYGGMAAVYAGTHRNGSRGAIKMLHPELSMDSEARQRFLREGYVANAVNHPSVVRVLDDDVAEDGSVFIVMELLEGETLDERLHRLGHPLSPQEVLCAIDPVLSALAAAHEKGIIHRDIKPDNLFVNHDGTVKLLDFGVARLPDAPVTVTRSGSMVGTPAFMPPEQALGRNDQIDARSDLWALGATVYYLLSGRLVHDATTPNEHLVAAATRRAPALVTVVPEVPDTVAAFVDRSLAFEPDARWQDAVAMQDALRETYADLAGSSVETAPRLDVPRSGPVDPEATLVMRPLTATTGNALAGAHSVSPASLARPNKPLVLGVVAGALVLAFAIATGAFVLGRQSSPAAAPPVATPSSSAVEPIPAVPEPPAPPPAAAPVASAPPAAPVDAAPMGRVRVVVRRGRCVVKVGDLDYDDTPLAVPVGDHVVTCKPEKGPKKKQRVKVREGAERVVTFELLPGGT
jgi:serine/threonine-protein kinase